MKKTRCILLLIAVFLLPACSKVLSDSSKTESHHQDINIYGKKYYLLPNDIFSNREVSLSKSPFIYFYKDLLTIWAKNNFENIEYREYNYSVDIYYFRMIDEKLFYCSYDSKSAPKTPLFLNKAEDFNDEIATNFYKEVPFENVHFNGLYYESGENLIYSYSQGTYAFYATIEAATELGVVFVD